MPEPEAPDFQITSYLAVHALNGQNVALGARFGIRCPKKKDLYFGPEVVIAPAGQSSVVYTLITAEQQMNLAKDGRVSGGAVAWLGLGFPQNLPGAGASAFAFGAEFFVARRIDELARMRVLVRAGLLSGRFLAMGGVGVAFRL